MPWSEDEKKIKKKKKEFAFLLFHFVVSFSFPLCLTPGKLTEKHSRLPPRSVEARPRVWLGEGKKRSIKLQFCFSLVRYSDQFFPWCWWFPRFFDRRHWRQNPPWPCALRQAVAWSFRWFRLCFAGKLGTRKQLLSQKEFPLWHGN